VEAVRSTGATTRNRVAAWAAHYCAQIDRAEIVASDAERFDAGIETGEIGPLRFARLSCVGSAIDRYQAPAAPSRTPSYAIIVQLTGSGTLSQYGQRANMLPGDIALCDNAAPHSHYMAERSELILLRVPAAALRAHLPSPERFCGRRLTANTGTTRVAASLVANLCRDTLTGLPSPVQERLAHQALEMISISYSLAFETLVPPSSVVGGRFAEARRFIEQHLRDPELDPQQIARSLNVSSRYLRMIFAAEKETVSSYVLRRRLEEVAYRLADGRWRGRSICEIAFDWGFNSAPHFSRSFRERYGMSPREYRALRCGANGCVESNTVASTA
jgi:AraC-like DNA-binding protein